MSAINFRPFPFRPFPKEKQVGTDGIKEILMSVLPVSVHSRNAGNGRERTGTDELKPGMFFHSLDAAGRVEHQGFLLVLTAAGFGRAQLFEWFWGDPSIEIDVNPDYLRNCIFYASCTAMNAAYAAMEPFAGAAGTFTHTRAVNATWADFVATPIATSNWTDNTENATRPRYTNDIEVSNEF